MDSKSFKYLIPVIWKWWDLLNLRVLHTSSIPSNRDNLSGCKCSGKLKDPNKKSLWSSEIGGTTQIWFKWDVKQWRLIQVEWQIELDYEHL